MLLDGQYEVHLARKVKNLLHQCIKGSCRLPSLTLDSTRINRPVKQQSQSGVVVVGVVAAAVLLPPPQLQLQYWWQ